MNLLNMFNALFPAPPTSESTRAKLKKRENSVVSRLARGNVALQNGSYMSSDDIAKLKKKSLYR